MLENSRIVDLHELPEKSMMGKALLRARREVLTRVKRILSSTAFCLSWFCTSSKYLRVLEWKGPSEIFLFHSHFHSINRYLLTAYYAPGTVLGAGAAMHQGNRYSSGPHIIYV